MKLLPERGRHLGGHCSSQHQRYRRVRVGAGTIAGLSAAIETQYNGLEGVWLSYMFYLKV